MSKAAVRAGDAGMLLRLYGNASGSWGNLRSLWSCTGRLYHRGHRGTPGTQLPYPFRIAGYRRTRALPAGRTNASVPTLRLRGATEGALAVYSFLDQTLSSSSGFGW